MVNHWTAWRGIIGPSKTTTTIRGIVVEVLQNSRLILRMRGDKWVVTVWNKDGVYSHDASAWGEQSEEARQKYDAATALAVELVALANQ